MLLSISRDSRLSKSGRDVRRVRSDLMTVVLGSSLVHSVWVATDRDPATGKGLPVKVCRDAGMYSLVLERAWSREASAPECDLSDLDIAKPPGSRQRVGQKGHRRDRRPSRSDLRTPRPRLQFQKILNGRLEWRARRRRPA